LVININVLLPLFTGSAPPEPVVPPPKEVTPATDGIANSDGSATGGKNDLQNNSTKEPAFDEKAIQRTFLVLAGLGTILLAYFGIKFAWLVIRHILKHCTYDIWICGKI